MSAALARQSHRPVRALFDDDTPRRTERPRAGVTASRRQLAKRLPTSLDRFESQRLRERRNANMQDKGRGKSEQRRRPVNDTSSASQPRQSSSNGTSRRSASFCRPNSCLLAVRFGYEAEPPLTIVYLRVDDERREVLATSANL